MYYVPFGLKHISWRDTKKTPASNCQHTYTALSSHQCDPGSIPARRHVWFEFSPGASRFPPSWKSNISKFQFNLDRGPVWKPARTDVASSLQYINFIPRLGLIRGLSWSTHHNQQHILIHHTTNNHLFLTRTVEGSIEKVEVRFSSEAWNG